MMKCENGMDVAVNRTNNLLERFNRRMNQEIPSKLTMQVFVTKIEVIIDWCIDETRRIKVVTTM